MTARKLVYVALFAALTAAGAFLAVLKNKAAKAMAEKNALLVKANLNLIRNKLSTSINNNVTNRNKNLAS